MVGLLDDGGAEAAGSDTFATSMHDIGRGIIRCIVDREFALYPSCPEEHCPYECPANSSIERSTTTPPLIYTLECKVYNHASEVVGRRKRRTT
jgi:hypothetical protein